MKDGEKPRELRDEQPATTETGSDSDAIAPLEAGAEPESAAESETELVEGEDGHIVPVLEREIPIADIDLEDDGYQFRSGLGDRGLGESLERLGQIEPIKVMTGDNGYTVLDGFCRGRELKARGATTIRALVYPKLSAKQATQIAIESNAKRKSLTASDRANAIHVAYRRGFTTAEIVRICGEPLQTVQRYLRLPDCVIKVIDGKRVTVAHGLLLAVALKEMRDEEEVRDWAERVRRKNMVAAGLETELESAGLLTKKGTKKKCYGVAKPGEVRVHARRLTKRSGRRQLEMAGKELEAVAAELKAILMHQMDQEGRGDET